MEQLPSKPGGVIVMLLHDSLSICRGRSGKSRVLTLVLKAELTLYIEDRGTLERERGRTLEGASLVEAF